MEIGFFLSFEQILSPNPGDSVASKPLPLNTTGKVSSRHLETDVHWEDDSMTSMRDIDDSSVHPDD